jgi:hypothetical protein
MKSWSTSYSYTSDGKNSSETVHKSYNNGKTIYEDGYTRTHNNNQNKELNEKFYKREIDQINKNEKSLLGKSKNKEDWELLGLYNGIQENKKHKYIDISNKYLERPSTRHRLTNSIQNKTNKTKNKIRNNNSLIEFDQEERLATMMQEMNLSMFDNHDFFKF